MNKLKEGIEFIRICKNWYSILPYYVRDNLLQNCKPSESKKILVKLRNGLKFFARARGNDLGIMIEIFHRDIYKFPKRKMHTVVDVGAHIGIFTCLAAIYADRVIAIEPSPDNFSLLKQNIKLNGFNNVIPIQIALSDKNGTSTFFLSEYGTGVHSLIPFNTNNVIAVKTCTMERLFEIYELDKVSFLKMDCEGCEYNVLKSSRELFSKIDQIAMESHHGYTEEIAELLAKEFVVSVKGSIIYGYKRRGK